VILKTVNEILEKTDNPSLYSIQVAAVRKLKSGDLDLYTHSVLERERLFTQFRGLASPARERTRSAGHGQAIRSPCS
jgi:hypothetical protein